MSASKPRRGGEDPKPDFRRTAEVAPRGKNLAQRKHREPEWAAEPVEMPRGTQKGGSLGCRGTAALQT